MDDEELVAVYERQMARYRAAGHERAPVRDAENVRRELVGVRVLPVRVRAEGFGIGAESFTWGFGPDPP
jgi:hypothetical protein